MRFLKVHYWTSARKTACGRNGWGLITTRYPVEVDCRTCLRVLRGQ